MICLMYSNVFVAFYFKLALSLLYFLCFFLCGRTPLCLFYVRCMFSPCWMDQCVSFTHREFSPDLTVLVETLDSFRRLRWPCLAWCFCPCVHILCCLTLIIQPTTETFQNFTQQLSYSFIRGTVTFFFFGQKGWIWFFGLKKMWKDASKYFIIISIICVYSLCIVKKTQDLVVSPPNQLTYSVFFRIPSETMQLTFSLRYFPWRNIEVSGYLLSISDLEEI